MARLTISNTSTKTANPCQMGRGLVGGCVKGSLSAETVSSRAAPGVAADVCGMLRTSTLMSSFLRNQSDPTHELAAYDVASIFCGKIPSKFRGFM